jgi:hypothetical protein
MVVLGIVLVNLLLLLEIEISLRESALVTIEMRAGDALNNIIDTKILSPLFIRQ